MVRIGVRNGRRLPLLICCLVACTYVLYVLGKWKPPPPQKSDGDPTNDLLQSEHNFFADVPRLVVKQARPNILSDSSTPRLGEPVVQSVDQSVQSVRQLFDETWIDSATLACHEKTVPLLLAVVISAPDHIAEREAIRDSWAMYARRKAEVVLIFLVGRSEEHMNDLKEEAAANGDVAISNIIDSYENLSLKTLSAFSWVQRFCPGAKYLLKVDDDVFIQMSRLHKLLRGLQASPLHRDKPIILGNVASGWQPVRNMESKYFISHSQYSESIYPAFVTGPSYVVSRLALGRILALAWDHPYISLEDVFVTGILAEKAGVPRRLVMEFKNNAERIPAKFIGCTLLRTIAIHKVLPEEQAELTFNATNPQCGPPSKKN